MKLKEICEIISLNTNIENDIEITGLNTLKESTKNQISFFDNQKYINDLETTNAAAVLIAPQFVHLLKNSVAIVTDEPYLNLAYISKMFASLPIEQTGEKPKIGENCNITNSYIGFGAEIGDNVTIMPNSFIGDNVKIGDNTIIYPNVSIYRDCKIGSNCIIHAGAVVGSDGFGFAHTKKGEHVKIYQNGNAIIEDEVEIGANCAIDRAVFGSTIIKRGAKIDNLVQIGHNCEIGEYSLLAGQVGLAGSSILERNVVMGGQSATAGHLKVGAFSTIAGRGGVTKNLEGKKVYSGFPAIEHKLWLKIQAKLSSLVK